MKTKRCTIFVVSVMLFIYISFILLDVNKLYSLSNYVKYAFMIAAFAAAVTEGEKYIICGMALTLICDYNLLFTDNINIGVFAFSFVHIIYTVYNCGQKNKAVLFPFFALPFIIILNKSQIHHVMFFYATCFALDIYTAFRNQMKTRPSFCAGLVFFALCDICVAIYNTAGNNMAFFLIWVFYAPSQALISLSPSIRPLFRNRQACHLQKPKKQL
ncbi:MAG: hypothetical protein HFE62_01925 [Firmicutes bacterium]|nr:hypothetical protein [Bacillota bacterium]